MGMETREHQVGGGESVSGGRERALWHNGVDHDDHAPALRVVALYTNRIVVHARILCEEIYVDDLLRARCQTAR